MRVSLPVLLASAAWVFTALPAAAQMPVSTTVRISGSCSKCNLSNRSMPGVKLEGSNFSGSDFSGSNLSGSTFNRSNLAGASFHKSYLMRIEGRNVILHRSSLRGSTLIEAKITGSNFMFADLRRSDLTNGTFSDCNFSNARLISVDAVGASFTGSVFKNAKFNHGNFTKADFSDTNLTGARFGHATVTDTIFTNAILKNTDLSGVSGLTQNQLNFACGNKDTKLPVPLQIQQCSEKTSDGQTILMQKTTLSSENERHDMNSMFQPTVENSFVAVERTTTSPSSQNDISSVVVYNARSEMDMAIKEIDRVIRDLPLDSPTRERLQKSRQHMENARSREH